MKFSRIFAVGCSLLALGAAAAENMIGRQTQNEGFFAVPVKGPVTIDGDLSEWDLSGRIWSFADTAVRDRFSVKTAAMWDPDNLYLSFYWKDPMPLNSKIDPDFEPGRGWLADAVQFRIIADEKVAWATAWSQGKDRPALEVSYWLDPASELKGTDMVVYCDKPGVTKFKDGVESAYRELPDGSGFVHELKLPWKVIYRKPKQLQAGDSLKCGLEFLWGDPTGMTWPIHRYADNMAPGKTSREFFWSAKDSWGTLTLRADSLPEERRYVSDEAKIAGTIPVTAEIPADASRFTLVIEDEQGNRIRNLAGDLPPAEYATGEARNGKLPIQVLWDGLTEDGKLAAPGTYRVRGLTHQGLGAEYEGCFYNPGTPPWATPDGTGAWGSDHSRPELAERSGELVILACRVVEGGYGIWAMGPDGKKRWSEKRAADQLTANDRYVFFVPNFWDAKEPLLIRLDAKTGAYSPFTNDLPFPLPLRVVLKEEKAPAVRALAASPDDLYVLLEDDRLLRLDPESGALRETRKLQADQITPELPGTTATPTTPLAWHGGGLWFFRDGKLRRHDLKSGAEKVLELTPAPERPGALALDRNGNPAVADHGKDLQIKVYGPDGKLRCTVGRRGGRALQGKFQSDGLREVIDLAFAPDGRLWVTEGSDYPRRVSVWNPDGSWQRDYIGNTGYSGTGSFLHDQDPTLAYVGPNQLKLDRQAGTWQMDEVLWNPPASAEPTYRLSTSDHGQGHIFRSSASGQEHEYYFVPPYWDWMGSVILMKRADGWKPVAALTSVGRLAGALRPDGSQLIPNRAEFARFNGYDGLIWNDLNADGTVQVEECEIIPALKPNTDRDRGEASIPLAGGWGQRMDPADLSFYGTDRHQRRLWKITPVGFAPDGAPRFSRDSIRQISELAADEAVPVPGEDTILTFAGIDNETYVAGLDKKTGALRWRYRSPYHQVHGSHRATMPRPGLLIGPLKITGVIDRCGEGGNVFMMRGNLGQDFYLTTDGLYVGAVFQDGRLPGTSLPPAEEQLRGMPMELFSQGSEPFNGWCGRQSDGVVRMTCGIPGQAAMMMTIKGLENIRRFNAPALTVSQADLIKADQANAARRAAGTRVEPIRITRVEAAPDWSQIPALRIARTGQPVEGSCQLAYTPQDLYCRFTVQDPSPWKNHGKEWTRLFKTGDAVDLQLSATANDQRQARAGDFRLLVAPFGEQPLAVMMERVAPGAAAGEKVRYQSPVGVVEFDRVRRLTAPEIKVETRDQAYTVTLRIPWRELGITPEPGLKLRGDVGFILSDPNGEYNTARVYYANADTNLVSDMPLEAELYPDRWTTVELAPAQ